MHPTKGHEPRWKQGEAADRESLFCALIAIHDG